MEHDSVTKVTPSPAWGLLPEGLLDYAIIYQLFIKVAKCLASASPLKN